MEKRELLELFMEALQKINRFVRSGTFEDLKPSITRVQWMILRHLSRHNEETIGFLAKHIDVRPSTMSQMIDRLEKAKLVYRTAGFDDGRARVVRLTEKGKMLIHEIEKQWIEALSGPFEHLTPEERVLLVDLITKLASNLPKRGVNNYD